jgi:hypothetical protein
MLFVNASAMVLGAAVMETIMMIGQRLEPCAHAWTTLFVAGARDEARSSHLTTPHS